MGNQSSPRGMIMGLVLLGLAVGGLAACGFAPLYGERGVASVSNEKLAAVQIDLIRDREGQMLRNQLLDRFQPAGAAPKPLYRLSVSLTIQRVGLAIRPDETGSRADLVMRADYTVSDMATGEPLFIGHGRSMSGYNVLDSEFATTSSEADAIRRAVLDLSEQITTRVSVVIAQHQNGTNSRL